MVAWKLFLDDIRHPNDDMSWRLARNYNDAVWYIRHYGIPIAMSLDHDLGEHEYGLVSVNQRPKENGMDFVKWFCQYVMEGTIRRPKHFEFYVHSQNPVGKVNMMSYFSNFDKEVWSTYTRPNKSRTR